MDQSGPDGETIIRIHLICTEGLKKHKVLNEPQTVSALTQLYVFIKSSIEQVFRNITVLQDNLYLLSHYQLSHSSCLDLEELNYCQQCAHVC